MITQEMPTAQLQNATELHYHMYIVQALFNCGPSATPIKLAKHNGGSLNRNLLFETLRWRSGPRPLRPMSQGPIGVS